MQVLPDCGPPRISSLRSGGCRPLGSPVVTRKGQPGFYFWLFFHTDECVYYYSGWLSEEIILNLYPCSVSVLSPGLSPKCFLETGKLIQSFICNTTLFCSYSCTLFFLFHFCPHSLLSPSIPFLSQLLDTFSFIASSFIPALILLSPLNPPSQHASSLFLSVLSLWKKLGQRGGTLDFFQREGHVDKI